MRPSRRERALRLTCSLRRSLSTWATTTSPTQSRAPALNTSAHHTKVSLLLSFCGEQDITGHVGTVYASVYRVWNSIHCQQAAKIIYTLAGMAQPMSSHG